MLTAHLLPDREENGRREAILQVEDQGGVVDSGHIHASQGDTRHHPATKRYSLTRRPDMARPIDFEADNGDIIEIQRVRKRETYGKRGKEFAHERATSAWKKGDRRPSNEKSMKAWDGRPPNGKS